MDTQQDVGGFLDLLQKSGLLPAERYEAVADQFRLAEMESPREIARTLVSRRLITQYHAARLLEGRYRGFFIDHYKLLELLGAGGMGYVYVAEDQNDGRRCAVKVLAEDLKNDAGLLARLRLEARAGLMLDHPNIVRTYKLGDAKVVGIPYLVMEYVEGISLPELVIKHGPCPWPQACDFIRQAAEGLAHAHEAGLVHRDIKPANLLIDRAGRVKILDFGLARLPDEEENEFSLTMIFGHDCVGTPDYMAPEQTVDSFAVDARADLYSLGLTLYSAMTGQFPFAAGSRSSVLQAQRTAEPPPLARAVPDLPAEVEAIFARMAAKRPEDRFATAREVAEALAPFCRRTPVEFDFRAILSTRARDARRRASALRQRKSRTRASSTIANAFAETSPTGRPLSTTVGRGSKPGSDSIARLSATGSGAIGEFGETNALAEAIHSESLAAPVPPGQFLVPVDGGAPIPLGRAQLVIGRGSGCDFVLPELGVSGRHCELRFEGGWWRVVDLRSKNGTRVNGAPVNEHLLWNGDKLTLAGLHTYQLETGSESRGRSRGWVIALAALTALAAGGAGAAVWWFAQ